MTDPRSDGEGREQMTDSLVNEFHAALVKVYDIARNGTRNTAAWQEVIETINEVIDRTPSPPSPAVDRSELLALADEFQAGTDKCMASGYEEYGPEFFRKRQLIVTALRATATPVGPPKTDASTMTCTHPDYSDWDGSQPEPRPPTPVGGDRERIAQNLVNHDPNYNCFHMPGDIPRDVKHSSGRVGKTIELSAQTAENVRRRADAIRTLLSKEAKP